MTQTPPAQIINVPSGLGGICFSRRDLVNLLSELIPVRHVQWREAVEAPFNLWAGQPTWAGGGTRLKRLPGVNVATWVWESTKLPADAVKQAELMDQIWVPTQFCRDIFIGNGVPAGKVRVIPYWLPGPVRPRMQPEADAPFTVLVSWDGKYSLARKNVMMSIDAFQQAFPTRQDVRLKLKTHDLNDERVEMLMQRALSDPRITLVNATTDTVDELFDGVHCLMHLHAAEGFGRHIAEAMQRYVPVICTAYGGCMDYLTGFNSFRVGYRPVALPSTESQYPAGGVWAEPNVHEATMALQICRIGYDDPIIVPRMVRRAQDDIAKATSRARCVHAMGAALEELGVI